MNYEQARDDVARRTNHLRSPNGKWRHQETGNDFPATLDGIASLWNEYAKDWDWSVAKGNDVNRNYSAEAFDSGPGTRHEFVEDQTTELEARTHLLAKVLEAKGQPQ